MSDDFQENLFKQNENVNQNRSRMKSQFYITQVNHIENSSS
jgi:hypothetical protein